MCEKQGKRPSRTSAITSGVEREPGEVTAPAMPQRASSSQKARRRRCVSAVSGMVRLVTPTVVLLHGFAGTRRGWDLVSASADAERYRPLALDLRGHGAARAARPVTFAACGADVLAAAPARFALCGYSMGGRLALHVALAAPDRVQRLVLVAATAGIEDDAERAARRAADERLAAFAERASIEQFADRWGAQPLFAGDPPAVAAFARADTLRNDPRALAAVLRGIGTGVMRPLWQQLGRLRMPVTVLAGERDPRYVALGERLVAALPDARLVVVPGAGHGLPREAPQAVAAAISGDSN
jgi:2-succinyl-6-hydroxy-2,4-cyclohexadiene-1-carboxylate synthase